MQETDKATIDVEAQDDGIMGKILSPGGTKQIPVGQGIAILAEEGDDLGSIEIPSDLSPPAHDPPSKKLAEEKESTTKDTESSNPAPTSEQDKTASLESKTGEASKSYGDKGATPNKAAQDLAHSKPLFPSVLRL